MRAVVQRVASASVTVAGEVRAAVGRGLLVYVGVAADDAPADAVYLADKTAGLRVFADGDGRMNRSVVDVGGEILAVSAFTVMADARRGRRPSFDPAARGDVAITLYDAYCAALANLGISPARGVFGADMMIESINDGPVCVLLESRRLF